MSDQARDKDEQDPVEDLELNDQSADKVTGGTPVAGTSNKATASQGTGAASDSFARS
jgi:hypothetical protein